MDEKLIKTLAVLEEANGWLGQTECAKRVGVSDRSVRTYVARLNRELEGVAVIESQRGTGLRLVVHDASGYRALLAESEGHAKPGYIPDTSDERARYILIDLLNRSDWVTVGDLAQVLFISPRTVSTEIARVEDRLAEFDLTLERRPRYGIRIAGSELKRRLCFANAVAEDAASPALPRELRTVTDEVAACVDTVLEQSGWEINGVSYRNLLVHISIAIIRMEHDCYVPMDREQLGTIKDAPAYVPAAQIARAIETRFGVELPDEEIAYIAIHLAGKRSLKGVDVQDGGMVISDEVWRVVSDMLERVWRAFRFDVRDDLELRMNLAQHIVPLMARLKYHMTMSNPLLEDIKTRLPLAYSMALDASSALPDPYGLALSDDEIGYIALTFALALERHRSEEVSRFNILVVCSSGAGSARLLEHRFKSEFGAYLDSILTCDVNAVCRQDFSHIDYVFTTVPLPIEVPVPVCEIGLFLNESDASRIRRVLQSQENVGGMARYFDERLFLTHLSGLDRFGVIHRLCGLVREFREVSDTFEELVFAREDAARTAFGNLVAMPHPAEAVSDETFVAVGLLDEPILWSGELVQAVFLVSVSRERGDDLDHFYASMADFLMDEESMKQLILDQRYQVLIELVERAGRQS